MDNQSTNLILPPEQTTTPPFSPPENLKTPLLKSRKILYLLIVLAVLILSTVILTILTHLEVQRAMPPETTTPLPTQTPTPNPAAVWQTYTNNNHQLSFQYPLSWTLTENIGEKVEGVAYNSEISLTKNDAKITMYFNIDGVGGKPVNYEGSPFTLDKYNLYQYTLTNEYGTQIVGLTDTLTNSYGVFQIESTTFMIKLEYPNDLDQTKESFLLNEFNQTLSTFRFFE